MNPMFLSMIGGKLGPLRQMFGMVQAAQNPQAALSQLSQTNPMVKQAMQLIEQSGGDGKAACYKLAQQYGIDPEQVLSMLKL